MKTFILAAFLLVHAVVAPASGQSAYPTGDVSVRSAWRRLTLDDEGLKAVLKAQLLAENDVDTGDDAWSYAARFKELAGLSDERLRSSLADIYSEAAAQLEAPPPKDSWTLMEAKKRMTGAVFWFGILHDAGTKAFLMDLAADTSQASGLRMIAMASYLRIADANETRDALVRF